MRRLGAVFVVLVLVAAAGVATARTGPKARFKASPLAPVVGQPVKLDARGSKCKRCRYRWHQLVGNKKKARKLGKGRGKVLRVRFRTNGRKRIRLTVTDRQGRRYRRTKSLRIRLGAKAPGGVIPVPGSGPPPGTRTGCFSDPSACGYPDVDNTGPSGSLTPAASASLPSGASWDTGTRTLRITGDNVTVQNLDIPGPVEIGGNNATIRNSRIVADDGCSSPCGNYGVRLGEADDTVSGTVLEDLDIVTGEQDPSNDDPLKPETIDTKLEHGVRNNGDEQVKADGLYVKGFGGAWKGPGTITNSYLFAQLVFADDHVQAYLNGGEGDPSILVHNTILNPVAQTSAISFFNDFGGIGQVTVDNNLLAGGGYVMYGGAKNGTGNVTGPIVVRNNRIARKQSGAYYANGGSYGLWADFNRNATQACGNYWDDNLAPTPRPDSAPC